MCAKQRNDGNLIRNVFNKLDFIALQLNYYTEVDIIMLKKKRKKEGGQILSID